MYRGSNKTAIASQQLIAEALLRLLEDSAYADVSISRICKEAEVSRQTFYTLFGSKENVMIYELTNNCRYMPGQSEESCKKESLRSFCRNYSRYIIAHRHVMELLVRNDMIHCLYDMQYNCFMSCDHFVRDIDDEERAYLVDFISSGLSTIAKNYVLSGCRADEGRLESLIYRLFSGQFFA